MWLRCLGLIFIMCAADAFAERLDSVVAVVNDGVVTQRELDEKTEEWRQHLQAKHTPVPSDTVLQKQVLNRLIDESLQLQIASHSGLEIDNVELDDAISKIADQARLSVTELRQAIEKEGMNFESYRESIRKEMLVARMQQQAIGRDIIVSNEQVEDYLKTSLASEKASYVFHLQNLLIALPDEPTPDVLKGGEKKARTLLKVLQSGKDFDAVLANDKTDDYPLDVVDLGDRHLAELPELFARRVVEMEVGEIAGPIRTGNGFQLVKLVSVKKPNKHHDVMKTHVRHILIKQDASTTEADARRRSQNLYEQLKSGKSFAELAKQYSVDRASAVEGGDLGWVTPEELVPAFAEVMQSLPLKTVSKPVKTGFGWHLIEVLERKRVDDSEAYEKQQVRQYLQQRKFLEAVESWQQHVRSTSYVQILKEDLA